MRTKLWGGIGLLVSVAATMSAANAADMAVKAPVYKAPPPPVILSDWSGFYIGAHGGGGWGETAVPVFSAAGAPLGNVSTKQSGGLGGGHVGYNWQFGSFVAGVEGDFDGADITGTSTSLTPVATFNTDELASVRGRLGYIVMPQVLIYGTGGAGWENTKVSSAGLSDNTSQWGWVAGGGVEYKFYQHWIARAEYLHYGFDATTNSTVFGPITEKSINVVRGGLSYKF